MYLLSLISKTKFTCMPFASLILFFFFCLKCFLFQFLSGCIRMHILILTGVLNGRTSLWKSSKKCFFLRLYFRDEGHLYTKFLLDILTIDPKCHLFQFFSRDMRMYIPILTGVQNRRINLRKNSVILLKNCFVKIYFLRWNSRKLLCLYSDYLP